MGDAIGNKMVLTWLLILVTIFVTIQTLMVDEVSGAIIFKTTVMMINNMSKPLVLHCKDKNHDNGFVGLNPGQSYSFKFITNPFLNRTLYYCSVAWRGVFHRFDIYNELRDQCKNCIWEIFENRLCKISADDRAGECFNWSSLQLNSDHQEENEENININIDTHHALIQDENKVKDDKNIRFMSTRQNIHNGYL
ncbi:putative plant self-incompatibility S1 [Lupinus albus]|uniref:S-protein homolog n=1 Tax=Lupinus albus TaxID=3870 RepID=A0A6A4QFX4_LUPAL|nr:putative plant self-incompatibility S1 [Lupinus albus]